MDWNFFLCLTHWGERRRRDSFPISTAEALREAQRRCLSFHCLSLFFISGRRKVLSRMVSAACTPNSSALSLSLPLPLSPSLSHVDQGVRKCDNRYFSRSCSVTLYEHYSGTSKYSSNTIQYNNFNTVNFFGDTA